MLQGAFAQLLCQLTGQHDVVFGTTVSGRPAEVAGADSMVGLFINTVPVRANITAATTTTDLLDQLQRAHTQTLEHQHLALTEIHHLTGHDQLFDTVYVYENYPFDAAAMSGDHGMAITEFAGAIHYPLSLVALPSRELGLRVEFDTDVFDAESIERLIERLHRVLAAMARRPVAPVVVDRFTRRGRARPAGWVGQPRGVEPTADDHAGVDSGDVRRAGGPHTRRGGADLPGPLHDVPGTGRGR